MKKILFVMAAMLLVFTSCKEDKCQFNKTLENDYQEVIAQYPGAEGQFREAQLVLTDSLQVADPKTFDVVNAVEIFQTEEDTCGAVIFKVRNAVTDTLYTVQGMWLGSANMVPSDVKVTLPDALRALQSADVIIPETNLVTLRIPLNGAVSLNPLYIFGSNHTSFVCVDGVTGEVFTFDGDITSGIEEGPTKPCVEEVAE